MANLVFYVTKIPCLHHISLLEVLLAYIALRLCQTSKCTSLFSIVLPIVYTLLSLVLNNSYLTRLHIRKYLALGTMGMFVPDIFSTYSVYASSICKCAVPLYPVPQLPLNDCLNRFYSTILELFKFILTANLAYCFGINLLQCMMCNYVTG